MNFEPQKFFLGLMDFFTILLPGALLTYLGMDLVGPLVLGERYRALDGAEGWAAFLFASYLVGHLVFLLGSWLDEFYDWARGRTLDTQIRMLARRGRLPPWPARALLRLVFKADRNLAVNRTVRLKQQALAPLQAADAVNAFQWSKALLTVESPESLALVQRFEADSKFFRCLAVVLALLLVTWPLHRLWPVEAVPVVLGLLLLALWRYMEQRHKATNQAYWSVLTLTARAGKVAPDKPAAPTGEASRAGGVVFRRRGRRVEYLLVEANRTPQEWVLPKGHIEEGEHPRETAVREVHEETGVWARIRHDLGEVSYPVDGKIATARFFVMEAVGRGVRKDSNRLHRWHSIDAAVHTADHTESRQLLRAADLWQASNAPGGGREPPSRDQSGNGRTEAGRGAAGGRLRLTARVP